MEPIPFSTTVSFQGPSTDLEKSQSQGAQQLVLLSWEHPGLFYRYTIKPSEEHLNEPIKTRKQRGGNYHVLKAHQELSIVLGTSISYPFPVAVILVRYYCVHSKAAVETEAKRGKTSAEGYSVSMEQCEQFKLKSFKLHHFHFSMVFSNKASFWRVGARFQNFMISDSQGILRKRADHIVQWKPQGCQYS